jgi:hypothetical protein
VEFKISFLGYIIFLIFRVTKQYIYNKMILLNY